MILSLFFLIWHLAFAAFALWVDIDTFVMLENADANPDILGSPSAAVGWLLLHILWASLGVVASVSLMRRKRRLLVCGVAAFYVAWAVLGILGIIDISLGRLGEPTVPALFAAIINGLALSKALKFTKHD